MQFESICYFITTAHPSTAQYYPVLPSTAKYSPVQLSRAPYSPSTAQCGQVQPIAAQYIPVQPSTGNMAHYRTVQLSKVQYSSVGSSTALVLLPPSHP